MVNAEKQLKDFRNLEKAITLLNKPGVVSVQLRKFNLTYRSPIVRELIIANPKYETIGNLLKFANKEKDRLERIERLKSDIENEEKRLVLLQKSINAKKAQLEKTQKGE